MGNCSISKKTSSTKGVSTLVETLFLLSITALLIGIVLVNYYSIHDNIRETSTRAILTNIAGKIAQDVHTVYALAIRPGNFMLEKKLEIPDRVGGSQYIIELRTGEVIVKQGGIEVKAAISSKAPVENSSASSYNAYLVYNLTKGKIEVVNK